MLQHEILLLIIKSYSRIKLTYRKTLEQEGKYMSAHSKWYPLFTKTTLLLFWLEIIRFLTPWVPVLSYVLTAVHIYSLFRLRVINPHFRTAAILEIAALAGRLLLPVVPGEMWMLFRTILTQGLNLLWVYYAFAAFSAVLKEIDPSLSDKWLTIRCGYLIVNVITTIGIELYSYFTDLFNVILLAAIIGSFTVDALILIIYWKTYKTLKHQ